MIPTINDKPIVANNGDIFSSILTILHSNIVSQLQNGEPSSQLVATYGDCSSKRQLATREEK